MQLRYGDAASRGPNLSDEGTLMANEVYAKINKYGSDQYAEFFGMTQEQVSEMLAAQSLTFEFIDQATFQANAEKPVS